MSADDRADGDELFDTALAIGIDTGRYAMNGERIVRGPNFDTVPPWPFDYPGDRMGWAHRAIDDMLSEPTKGTP